MAVSYARISGVLIRQLTNHAAKITPRCTAVSVLNSRSLRSGVNGSKGSSAETVSILEERILAARAEAKAARAEAALMKHLIQGKNNRILAMSHLLTLCGALESLAASYKQKRLDAGDTSLTNLHRPAVLYRMLSDTTERTTLEEIIESTLREYGRRIGASSLKCEDLLKDFTDHVAKLYKKLSTGIHQFKSPDGYLMIDGEELEPLERVLAITVCSYLDLKFRMKMKEEEFDNSVKLPLSTYQTPLTEVKDLMS